MHNRARSASCTRVDQLSTQMQPHGRMFERGIENVLSRVANERRVDAADTDAEMQSQANAFNYSSRSPKLRRCLEGSYMNNEGGPGGNDKSKIVPRQPRAIIRIRAS